MSFVAVTAIFVSNIPEGLSSAAGMKKAGRGAGYVFGADTMIPEAFDVAHDLAGLITVAGFLASFVLSKLGG